MKSPVCAYLLFVLFFGMGQSYILRLENVVIYYELSSSNLTYNRIEVALEKGPKRAELEKIEDPSELVIWIFNNAWAVLEHQTYPGKSEMMDAQRLEEAHGKKTTLSVGFSRKLKREARRKFKLRRREKRVVPLAQAFVALAGSVGALVSFAVWFIKELHSHRQAILYGRAEAKLYAKIEPSHQEQSFVRALVESQKYSKELFDAMAIERRTFSVTHSAQIKSVSGRNKVRQQNAKKTSASQSFVRLTYVTDSSGTGRFVAVSSSGNEPPTRPPRPTPKPTPAPPLMIDLASEEGDKEVEVLDDDDDVEVVSLDTGKKIGPDVGRKRKRPDLDDADPYENPVPGPSRPRQENLDKSFSSVGSSKSAISLLDTSEEELRNANLPDWEKFKLTREEYEKALLLSQHPPETLYIGEDLRVTTFDAPANVQNCGILPRPENVADERPSHQQQCGANRIASQEAIPPSVLSAHEQRVAYHLARPEIPTLGPSRPGGEILSLWRGLSWHTPTVENACNIDSFLTYVLFRSTEQPDFAERYFLIPRNVAEGALRLAIREYSDRRSKSSDAARMTMNSKIKTTWAVANFWKYREQLDKTQKMDVIGSERGNIAFPLQDSSVLLRTTVCQCQEEGGQNELFTENLQSLNTFWTAGEIRSLVESGEVTNERVCKVCKSARAFRSLYVPDTTWYLHFGLDVSERHLNQFPVADIPETLTFNELSRPESRATFELGYVSLTNRLPQGASRNMVTHQTSLMRFGNQWWHYNDMERDGRLLLVANPDDFIKKFGLSITAANYFRK